MPEALSFLGFIIAAVMTGVAFLCWRKAMSYHVLLVESSHRIEGLKRKGRHVEQELAKQKEKLDATRTHKERLEKDVRGQKNQRDSALESLQQSEAQLRDKNHQLDLKNDHLRTQVETLTQQLRESESKLKDIQNKLSYESQNRDEQVKSKAQELNEEIDQWRKRCRAMESDYKNSVRRFETLKRKVKETDLGKAKEYKRKSVQYMNLYKSMRGLREMAEERNENWEAALRKLAAWVLRGSQRQVDAAREPIGPMVGEALEVIGEQLVIDEFSSNTGSDKPPAKHA